MHQGGRPSLPKTRVTPKAAKRRRANPGKSAKNLPWPTGTKQSNTAAICNGSTNACKKAVHTSAPTSKACGPMHGPNHAINSGAASACSTEAPGLKDLKIDSKIPAPPSPASPRHPACAAATQVPSVLHSSTGRQSATITVHTRPASSVQAPSAIGAVSAAGVANASPALVVAASTCGCPFSCNSAVPCTWVIQTGATPSACPSTLRLWATACTVSPTCKPKFKLSYGGKDSPPARVVQTACTPAGAGQSGSSQSEWKWVVPATDSSHKVWASRGLRLLKRGQSHAGVKRRHRPGQVV